MVDITPELVRWAYRLFLDREPDDEEWVIAIAKEIQSTRELRRNLMISPEFRERNQEFLRLANAKTVVIAELGEGLRIHLDLADYAISWNVLQGAYEPMALAWAKSVLKPGDTVLDLGANLGVYSIQMASWVGEEGIVYAFEPLSSNLSLLRKSVAENGYESRIVVSSAAVGEKQGRSSILFIEEGSSSGGSHLVADDATAPPLHGIEEVAVVALDDCDLRRPIQFIKMDIEGAEPLACRGAETILAEDRPIILSEINPVHLNNVAGSSAREFISEMQEREYSCFRLENGDVGRQISDADSLGTVAFLPSGEP